MAPPAIVTCRELSLSVQPSFSIPTKTARSPILLEVDQQLREGAVLRDPLELTDPVGSLEVGEHQDVEQFGARRETQGVEARSESAL